MKRNQYTSLADYYDRLNTDLDYKAWAEFLHSCFVRYSSGNVNLVLDLACGTGLLSVQLAKMKYDVIGIDLSVEMLMSAHKNADDSGVTNLLLLNQDMREFELYGTVDAVVCCLDSINYLTGDGDLSKCFNTVHNYLNPDALFIFDVNTPYKFLNIYAEHDYVLENKGVLCAWQNHFNPQTQICDFYLSIFAENADRTYKRFNEYQSERMYSFDYLQNTLLNSGFEILDVVSDFKMVKHTDNDERWFFIAKAKKN